MESQIIIQVRYSDVDLMNVVYNAKYYEYYELGRLDFIGKFVMPYNDLIEKERIQIPVTSNSSKYYGPAKYADDLLLITKAHKLTNKRLSFSYKLFKSDTLIAEGLSEHSFIKNGVLKSIEVPNLFVEKLRDLPESECIIS
ncbi:MAG TPA: thioesterase family protein [Pyrinomonadaceae bacterium]|jgi:acyl-CoA thioester hydrolase